MNGTDMGWSEIMGRLQYFLINVIYVIILK